MNAVFHGSMNRSIAALATYHILSRTYIVATYTQQRSEAEATLQVQGVMQTIKSLNSGCPTRASRRRQRPTRLLRREMCRLRCFGAQTQAGANAHAAVAAVQAEVDARHAGRAEAEARQATDATAASRQANAAAATAAAATSTW